MAPNSEHHRRGDAVSELMPWLSSDAAESTQMVAIPILLSSACTAASALPAA